MLHHDDLLPATRGRIIAIIRRGHATVDDIATELELTGNAVRAQLANLERDGVIRVAGTRRGVTRPAQTYEVTPQVEQLLSRAYVPMLTELVGVLAETQSEGQFDAIMRETCRRLARDLTGTPAGGPLRDRAETASQLMNRELGAAVRVEHAPAAGHAQVRVDREVVGEADEQVLAVRVDAADRLAFQPLRPAVAAEARVQRLERVRDVAFEDRPDAVRGVVDRVALGHLH